MITGYNTDIRHQDRVFHVQTEDKGAANPVIESLIYLGGKIIASRQYSYAWLLKEAFDEKAVQDLLDCQHRKMMRDIRGGKYDPEGPPPFGAGIITDRGFDDLVLEFVREQVGSETMEILAQDDPEPRAGQLMVLGLLLRTDISARPVPAARVTIRAAFEGREVVLFEGASGDDGTLKAGLEVPPGSEGGRIVVEAAGPPGGARFTLEIQGT